MKSCIQIRVNNTRNNSIWKRKFNLIIKDPKIIKQTNNQYFLYFGEVLVLNLKSCYNSNACEYNGEYKQKNVGILSDKPSVNLKEFKNKGIKN